MKTPLSRRASPSAITFGSDASCRLTLVTDLLLGPLADNGGPTLTHLPLEDSPAIDDGECVTGLTADQRGRPRPQGATCDIGAVEYGGFAWQVYVPLARG